MNFRKTAIALSTAGALAAGSMAVTQPAQAVTPAWVIPAIVAVGVGGLALGAATHAHAHPYDGYGPAYYGPGYGPAGVVSVRANVGGQCWIENRRGGPVQVCRR